MTQQEEVLASTLQFNPQDPQKQKEGSDSLKMAYLPQASCTHTQRHRHRQTDTRLKKKKDRRDSYFLDH